MESAQQSNKLPDIGSRVVCRDFMGRETLNIVVGHGANLYGVALAIAVKPELIPYWTKICYPEHVYADEYGTHWLYEGDKC